MSKKTKPKAKPASKAKAKKPASPKSKSAVKAKPAKKVVAKKPVAKKAVKSKTKTKPKAAAKPAKKASAPAKPISKSKPAAKHNVPPAKTTTVKNNMKESTKAALPKEAEKTTDTNKQNSQQQQRPSVGRPMPVNRRPEPARAIISNSKPEKETGKNRYSDTELEEFRDIINKKLDEARKELATLQAQMTAANEHGTDDTASTFKILEDGSDSLAKEEAGQLAGRQKKFIEQLENALVRIENKTYGICRVTGKLIPKERLRAVPHTTQSIEAKLNQYRD